VSEALVSVLTERIFLSVTKKRILVTPAPTAASVIARSGDSRINQIIAITRLNAMYKTTDTRSLLEKLTEMAHIIKKSNKIIRSTSI